MNSKFVMRGLERRIHHLAKHRGADGLPGQARQ
jgi:hypothetical protein